MTGTLDGRVALVMGASRGLGAAVATAYAREGAAVVLAARSADAVEALADAITREGGRALAVRADVREESQIASAVAAVRETFGRIDVLVNNAGAFVHAARFPRLSVEEWDEAFDVNLKAAWLTAKHAAPHMDADGSIINLASGLAHVGPGRGASTAYAPYSIAKAALEDLTRVLAERVTPRVNAVNPGVIRTEMSNGLGLDPEYVTPLFVWLASPESRDVNGQIIRAQEWFQARPHLSRRGSETPPAPTA